MAKIPEPAAGKPNFDSPLVIGAQVIDEDYQGEIHIHLINTGYEEVHITPGMKIAQFILVPVSYAEPKETPDEELFRDISERTSGGFSFTE
jgi:dUTPase